MAYFWMITDAWGHFCTTHKNIQSFSYMSKLMYSRQFSLITGENIFRRITCNCLIISKLRLARRSALSTKLAGNRSTFSEFGWFVSCFLLSELGQISWSTNSHCLHFFSFFWWTFFLRRQGEIVDLVRRVDNNWWEVRQGIRSGIVPTAYIEVLREPQQGVCLVVTT